MDIAFELTFLTACKLIVYSFGALVHLFLMVLILGQRRLGRLQWLLFALTSALFMWNSGNLLAMNVALAYGLGPTPLACAARLIPLVGFLACPPLLVHVHAEYAFAAPPAPPWILPKKLMIIALYLPLVAAPWAVARVLSRPAVAPQILLRIIAHPIVAWALLALLVAAALNFHLRWISRERRVANFHGWLGLLECALAAGLAWTYLFHPLPVLGLGGYFPTFLMGLAVVPGALTGGAIIRYGFFDLRVQRNLVYSVVALFALLIYIDFIRRLSGYLDDRNFLPAPVTEAVMIFIMVVFLEPVKRRIDRLLQAAFRSEFALVQRLSTEIQNYAKQTGDLAALERYVEQKVPAELGLASAKIELGKDRSRLSHPETRGKLRVFPIRRADRVIGVLEVVPVEAELSGNNSAALQLLADHLAAAIELCQLIADKVQLERALAEKAKLAFLGEMAARIAHNVKNPLSSMKTLVQLLEEDDSLPARARRDCRMVVAEIDRLNANISQVLRYAKPARDVDRPVDLTLIVDRVVTLARADAERRQVKLESLPFSGAAMVEGGEEAASDIVSNLVVNALEASPAGTAVRIAVRAANGDGSEPQGAKPAAGSQSRSVGRLLELVVEDQGPGIAGELKAQIFQPFFTTRPGGTGLGLAIVARRAEEVGGAVECQSPREDGRGTRFVVRFRASGA